MILKTLFLDAGGVLMNPDWDWVSTALGEIGIQVTAEALAGAEPHVKRAMDTPESIRASDDASRAERYFLEIVKRAGVRAGGGVLDEAWTRIKERHARSNVWSHVPAGVPQALARLRGFGLDLVVVSNANGTLHAHLEHLELLHFFSHVIDSHLVGVEKPNPRIFEIALERSAARRDTTVHVGDIYEIDVVGARAAGLHAILLDPAGLHADRDCTRYVSLATLGDAIASGDLRLEERPFLR